MRTAYNSIILTPKRDQIKKTCPRDQDGDIKLCAMGEVGERCVAQTLRNCFKGDDPTPLPFNYGPEYIPITTNQLVELKMMTVDEEKKVQLAGVDVIIIPDQWREEKQQITLSWVLSNTDKCIQVKFQPWAPNYGSITVETCRDNKYVRGCSLTPSPGRYTADGINKTSADWTAYIVSAGTIILMKTDELRNSIHDKERKHIGAPWGWSKDYPYSKRAVGTTSNLLSLLQSPASTALGVDEVFRTYLSSLTNVDDDDTNLDQYSWKLCIQDWTPSTLIKFLGSGMAALTEDQVKGSRFIW